MALTSAGQTKRRLLCIPPEDGTGTPRTKQGEPLNQPPHPELTAQALLMTNTWSRRQLSGPSTVHCLVRLGPPVTVGPSSLPVFSLFAAMTAPPPPSLQSPVRMQMFVSQLLKFLFPLMPTSFSSPFLKLFLAPFLPFLHCLFVLCNPSSFPLSFFLLFCYVSHHTVLQ